MRVLYICHRIPYPPDKGDKIRFFHQLRALAARHKVDVFTLADRTADLTHRKALEAFCNSVTVVHLNPKLARIRALSGLFGRKPLTLPYFYSAELDAQIRAALTQRCYDRIFVACSAVAQYVEWVHDIPIVMDLVDVDSHKWTQYADITRFPYSAVYRREGKQLREYERKICEQFAAVLVSTEREAQILRQISGVARVHVVSNGVDADFFKGSLDGTVEARPTVVFSGDMSYFPNEDAVRFFALKVLPLIRQSVPQARFLIVGREPGRNVRRLEGIEGVEVTGFVPDVRSHLARAHVSVAPFLIAAGIQNKILEALAYGLPVVATSRAVQGLSRAVAEIVETGNTAEELAEKTVRLLRDPQFARRKASEGRDRVTSEYDWDKAMEQLLQLVEDPSSADLQASSTGRAMR